MVKSRYNPGLYITTVHQEPGLYMVNH